MRRKILVLIKKDICLCPAWLLVGILLTILMPTYIICSIEMSNVFHEPILILCAICTSNLVVSRICYIEDNQAVKTFLHSIPVTKSEFITARVFVAVGLTILFILLAEGIGLLMGVVINLMMLLAGITIGLSYESVYLILYYKWGNQIAQYALVIFIVGCVVIGWILSLT